MDMEETILAVCLVVALIVMFILLLPGLWGIIG